MRQYRFLPGFLTGVSLLLLSATVAQPVRIIRSRHGAEGSFNARDSAQVFSLLDKADQFKELSKLDSATSLCMMALQLSKAKKMLRGEAFANLALGDIEYRMSGWRAMKTYDSMGLQLGIQLKDSFLI